LSFTSAKFLIFLTAALICYFAAPRSLRRHVLLAASYVFYWLAGGLYALGVITFTALSVWLCGLWAGRLRADNAPRALRRAPLALCLTVNFGLLVLFKYGGKLLPDVGLILIPGISFYTFQSAGYLIDVYKGKAVPERDPLKFTLFVSFFPQLIQGPISRHGEIADSLLSGAGWDFERARRGVGRIIWGYFMKLAIADVAAIPVGTVFGDYEAYGGAVIAAAALLYSVQIYADFAGGINVALGIAELVGVKLPENFNNPFFARSLADFWRRWHITLGLWLKDYLFYPIAISKPMGKIGSLARRALGMSLGKLVPAGIATFAVYVVMSIWHGASWRSLAFGLLNGGIITLSLYCEPLYARLRKRTGLDGAKPGVGSVFAILRTLALLTFLRYFARAGSFMAAVGMLRRTVLQPRPGELWDGTLMALGLGAREYILLGVSTALLLCRDIVAERGAGSGRSPEDVLRGSRGLAQYAALVLVLALIVYCGLYREGYIASGFIYANY
jgi:D-alanyl-lipoteichoic acid acyltransferase DltB (MBOAT superfamily)